LLVAAASTCPRQRVFRVSACCFSCLVAAASTCPLLFGCLAHCLSALLLLFGCLAHWLSATKLQASSNSFYVPTIHGLRSCESCLFVPFLSPLFNLCLHFSHFRHFSLNQRCVRVCVCMCERMYRFVCVCVHVQECLRTCARAHVRRVCKCARVRPNFCAIGC
jgi:hypothetical protein